MVIRFFLLVSAIVFSAHATAKQSYRFVVDGRTVIKDHVPQEYKHLGYEVVNARGFVIQTVSPALTPRQKAELEAKKAQEVARLKAIELRKEQDITLHRLYASPSDVLRIRQRKQDELKAYLQLQELQVAEQQKKLKGIQSQAAQLERQSKPIPESLKQEWATASEAIKSSQKNIQTKTQEAKQTDNELNEQYKRLHVLQLYVAGTLEEEVDYNYVNRTLNTSF